MWTWKAGDLSITYLTGTYPCPRNEEHSPPCCVYFFLLWIDDVCVSCFPHCSVVFLFWGQGLKNIIIGVLFPYHFFVEDLLLVSTPGVCGLDNNENKKKRESVRGGEAPVYPLTNLTVYTHDTTTPPPHMREFYCVDERALVKRIIRKKKII